MKDNFSIMLGEWLADQRKKANMTQIQIAERMGCSRQRINNWERGIRDMNAKDLALYCEIIHADLDELVKLMRNI